MFCTLMFIFRGLVISNSTWIGSFFFPKIKKKNKTNYLTQHYHNNNTRDPERERETNDPKVLITPEKKKHQREREEGRKGNTKKKTKRFLALPTSSSSVAHPTKTKTLCHEIFINFFFLIPPTTE